MGTVRQFIAGMWSLVKRNPVRTQALVQAIIGVATAFGLGWTAQQVATVMAASAAILALLTESIVTPLEAPVLPTGTSVTVTTPGPTADRTVSV